MSLDATVRQRLDHALSMVDEHGSVGPRLIDDAVRLWRRTRFFVTHLELLSTHIDMDALELSCYALQLPMRRVRSVAARRQLRTSLRDRCESAADLLMTVVGPETDEILLDRTTRILLETPQREPMLDEARVLSDAANLEDFGTLGLLQQTIALARQGEGIAQLLDGCEKREQYGYWEARLKDGFHFELIRSIAQRRVDNARLLCSMLMEELGGEFES